MTSKHKRSDKDRSRDRSRTPERREKKKKDRDRSRDRDRDREYRRKRSKERDRSRSRGRDKSPYKSRRGKSPSTSSRHSSRRSRSRTPPRRSEDRRRYTPDMSTRTSGFDKAKTPDFQNLLFPNDNKQPDIDPSLLSLIASVTSTTPEAVAFNFFQNLQQQNPDMSVFGTMQPRSELPLATATSAPVMAASSSSTTTSAALAMSDDSRDNSNPATERKRKKKSRWAGSDNDKTFIPGMPTILPPSMTPDQQEAYLVQLQIEEISRKLRTGDLGISLLPEERRSPSPEPIYSSDGKRLNTREFRTRKKLEEQRHLLIQRMQCMNPEFKPPSDYKPPIIRVSDKVLIPQEEHPDINFVGLLIGPRGNTLKAMEKETGAKIIIRGKGSVKEGKVGRKDGQPLPGEDEPLHAFITASNPEHVQKAVAKIKEVINQGIDVPEGHNDLRRMQLRELAQLNGTLRETDQPRCSNCGSTDHKSWLCSDKPNVTNNIVCSSCGGAGHISKDCRSKRPGMGGGGGMVQTKIDEEYLSLMAELGEAPPPESNQSNNGGSSGGHHSGPSHTNRIGGSIFDSRQNHQPRAIMGSNQQMPPWSHNNNNNSGQHHYHQQQHHHHQQHQQQQQHHHHQLQHYPQPPLPNPAIQPLLAWNQPPPPGMSHNGADHPPAPPGCAPLPSLLSLQAPPPPPPGASPTDNSRYGWPGDQPPQPPLPTNFSNLNFPLSLLASQPPPPPPPSN